MENLKELKRQSEEELAVLKQNLKNVGSDLAALEKDLMELDKERKEDVALLLSELETRMNERTDQENELKALENRLIEARKKSETEPGNEGARENLKTLEEKSKILSLEISSKSDTISQLYQYAKKLLHIETTRTKLLTEINEKNRETIALNKKIKEKYQEIDEIMNNMIHELQEKKQLMPVNNSMNLEEKNPPAHDPFFGDFFIHDPGPPLLYLLDDLDIRDDPSFMKTIADKDEMIEQIKKVGEDLLGTHHPNWERLEAFNEKEGFLHLYRILSILEKTEKLTSTHFEAITRVPNQVENIANILRLLDRHTHGLAHGLDISVIIYDVIRYSPLADSFIKKIPEREKIGQPALDDKGFRDILERIDLEIEAHNQMKTAYLRGFHPKKLESDSAMWVMNKDPLAEVKNTSKMIFSFLFPPPKLPSTKKSDNKNPPLKEMEAGKNNGEVMEISFGRPRK